jgi:parallel beta-helix repeat protein
MTMSKKRVFQDSLLISLLVLTVAFSSSLSAANFFTYTKPTYIYVNGNYVLGSNPVNCTMIVECDNVVIDGAGHTLQGPGGLNPIETGIALEGRKNVTLRDIMIDNYVTGIQLSDCENVTVCGNSVSNCAVNVELSSSNNCKMEENNITRGEYRGILFSSCKNITLTKNNITDN